MKDANASAGFAGETLGKVLSFVAVLFMTARWGAGWALAIYALIILAIIPAIMLFQRGRNASSMPNADCRALFKGLAKLATGLLCMSALCFLLLPLR